MTTTDTSPLRKPFTFTYIVGASTGDGHGKTEPILLRIWCCDGDPALQLEEIKQAYAAAKKRAPVLEPKTYCAEYEDNTLPDEVRVLWEAYGTVVSERIFVEDYARLCAAFLNIGNPDLKAEVAKDTSVYLNDIFGLGGYGLFSC